MQRTLRLVLVLVRMCGDLQPAMQRHLFEDIVYVALHRIRRQVQSARDLLVAQSAPDQVDDLTFQLELVDVDAPGLGGEGEEIGDFFGGDKAEFDEGLTEGDALAALLANGQVQLRFGDQPGGDESLGEIRGGEMGGSGSGRAAPGGFGARALR